MGSPLLWHLILPGYPGLSNANLVYGLWRHGAQYSLCASPPCFQVTAGHPRKPREGGDPTLCFSDWDLDSRCLRASGLTEITGGDMSISEASLLGQKLARQRQRTILTLHTLGCWWAYQVQCWDHRKSKSLPECGLSKKHLTRAAACHRILLWARVPGAADVMALHLPFPSATSCFLPKEGLFLQGFQFCNQYYKKHQSLAQLFCGHHLTLDPRLFYLGYWPGDCSGSWEQRQLQVGH
jgi:hypothetical protein